MFVRKPHHRMPKTLDDAAEKVISDLPGEHQEMLSGMTDDQFQRFYESVAKFILDDFNLWLGNQELLRSCYSIHNRDNASSDPARIILDRVREKLQETAGIVIIT
ncbi:MAG: hypothetical protein R6V60_15340 [Desulfobacterales bacterium]